MQQGISAMKQGGFTLIELLVVIGIIALLASILFPVFASARGKAREIVCVSNMRQIGMAISLYAQDADDRYPYAADPSDKYATPPIWPAADINMIDAMPLINPDPNVPHQPGVLTPYLKSAEIWRCPSDTGYMVLDNVPGSTMNAFPSSYQAYGSSYLTRTEIAVEQTLYSNVTSYDPAPACTPHGPSEVNILMDAYGGWHGGFLNSQKRYDVLMADGHVVDQSRDEYWQTWQRPLVQPSGCSGATP
jgi:general secretion pathway protein G